VENKNSKKEELSIEEFRNFYDCLLLKELKEFFQEFIAEDEEFVEGVFSYGKSKIPRRMLNSIKRLVSLPDDMVIMRLGNSTSLVENLVEIKPIRDGLKVFYYVVGIESLYKLSQSKLKKREMVQDFFNNHVSFLDKALIQEKVKEIFYEKDSIADEENFESKERKDIEIKTFADLINEFRNIFVHEGDYWKFSFVDKNSCEEKDSFSEIEEVEEEMPEIEVLLDKEKRYFELGLTYKEFRKICANGYISFVRDYYNQSKKSHSEPI